MHVARRDPAAGEQVVHFPVGGLGEVLIPDTHGIEGLGRLEAHDFVGDAMKLLARVLRRDGHRDDDPRG